MFIEIPFLIAKKLIEEFFYSYYQCLIVLVMVHVLVKAHVMAQQEHAFASKVLKDHLAFARVIIDHLNIFC